ncbi:MAG: rhodanese-like domain-containing protein [Nitrospirota bacterium]
MKKIILSACVLFALFLLTQTPAVSAETAQDLLKQGIDLYNKGEFSDAAKVLRKAITIEPGNNKLWRAYNDAYQADAATRFLMTLTGSYNAITYEEYTSRKRDNPGLVTIDLRGAKDYNEEHIPDAINIPLEEMRKNLDKLPALKITEIVVYCAAGPRSATGQMYLSMLGYTNVKYLRGGMMAYKAAKEKEQEQAKEQEQKQAEKKAQAKKNKKK